MRYIGFQPSAVIWNKSFIVLPLRTAHSDLYRQNLEPIAPKDSPWRKLSGIPLQPGRCQTGRDIQVRRWGCRRRPSSRSRRPSCSCSGCGQHRARQTPARSHKPPRTGCLQTNIDFSYEIFLSQLIFAFIKSNTRRITKSYRDIC